MSVGFGLSRRSFLAIAMGTGLTLPALAASRSVKIAVIGGGIAGTTFARSMRRLLPDAEITLIEKNKSYTCCFKSNECLFGFRPVSDVTRGYDDVSKSMRLIHGELAGIEPKLAVLKDGRRIQFDFAILATGVDFDWEQIDGYRPGDEHRVPHSWGGAQSLETLRAQLAGLRQGGTFVIAPPPGIYKCPPGPYERASLAARYIKRNRLQAKVLICDANNAFSKQTRFAKQWADEYGFGTESSIIEWLPARDGGAVSAIDTNSGTLALEGGEVIEYDVANIIPPQSAGDTLASAGLTDGTGWCPIDGLTMASRRLDGVYVIGDCAAVGDMPKSAFSAVAQAHHCAMNLALAINDQPPISPRLMNVCYSLTAKDAAISIAHRFRYDPSAQRIVAENMELSPLLAGRDELNWEAQQAENWFRQVTEQAFGEHVFNDEHS